jgi:putative transposase
LPELLKQLGMQASRSRRGNYFDNAPIESFWGSLKNEVVSHRKFATRDEAIKEITEYIEIFYNRLRTQERLDYLSPAAFTQRFHLSKIAA